MEIKMLLIPIILKIKHDIVKRCYKIGFEVENVYTCLQIQLNGKFCTI